MLTLAISSQKGGVGKTTVAINLAHAYARSGRKTLLVDTDPQGSVGLSLTRQSRHLSGFYDLMLDPQLDLERVIVPTRLETFSLLAAGQTSQYDLTLGELGEGQNRLRMFWKGVAALGYEFCIIDTAAGLYGLSADILCASSGVLVPQQAEPLGIRSVPKMLESLARLRAKNSQIRVLGVLMTMVQKNLAESREAAEALRSILPEEMVMQTGIPRDDIFVRASAKGLPVGVMDDGAGAQAVFDTLRAELDHKLDHMGLSQVVGAHE